MEGERSGGWECERERGREKEREREGREKERETVGDFPFFLFSIILCLKSECVFSQVLVQHSLLC